MKILQKGFNYSQDGPGNRLIYHLQGCNFACKWCSNADAIPMENPAAKDAGAEEILDEIMRSRPMFFDGGGVTFTGGEVCVQAAELLELLKTLSREGVNTAVETNCSLPVIRELAEYVDYLIADFKHYDDETHKKWIGASNKGVKENIEYFLKSGRQIHIRTPIVNGVNDDPAGFVDYFSRFDCKNAVFEFLPYHEFGKDKWKGEYQIKNGFVSPQTVVRFTDAFEARKLKTVVT